MAKKKNRRYVLFTLNYGGYRGTNYWTKENYTRDELINKIAVKEWYNPGSVINNTVNTLDNTYMDKKITYDNRYILGYKTDYIHKYLIAKEKEDNYIAIDISNWIIEINKVLEERYINRKHVYNGRKIPNYEFRRDPVPFIHNYNSWHRGCLYRHPKTTKSKRNNYYEDEFGSFTDTKTKNLPSVYDDMIRHIDKSWKTSCKVRKQWEKHNKPHADTIKYNKRNFIIDDDF